MKRSRAATSCCPRARRRRPRFHHFVLTTTSGAAVHASALAFYEPVGARALASAERALAPPTLAADGLFAGHQWRIATRPFLLDKKTVKQLEQLGRVLLKFYQAANMLYHWSAEGRLPAWPSAWLDRGKPQSIIDLQRSKAFRAELPRVIRPDILLTDDGLKITELDSVPGGIGLTAWLLSLIHI